MGRELFCWHPDLSGDPLLVLGYRGGLTCESSSVQDKGQEWFKVPSRREKASWGWLWSCGQHDEDQDASWWCVTNGWSWEFTGLS